MLDTLITRASVITMDPDRPVASAIGIWNGQIFGLDDEVSGVPARHVIDLGGATVTPGFIDAHTHLVWAGLAARSVDLSPCSDVDLVLATLAEAVRETSPGGWVEAGGYDQRALGRHLTRSDLDLVADGRLIMLTHVSGHACVVNSEVINRFPANAKAGQAPGVEVDIQGQPTGVLVESGTQFARRLRAPYSPEEWEAALRVAARLCAAQGVTTCAEAGIGGPVTGASGTEIAGYQRAHETGLPIRTQLMIVDGELHELRAHELDEMRFGLGLGLRTGIGGTRLSIGAMKLWLDGGMMARTAAMTSPYHGYCHGGELIHPPAEVHEIVRKAHTAGWQLALHAIGDKAVDLAIEALEKAQATHPRPAARHRIEHCGVVRPDQLKRLAELGVIAVIQPRFLYENGDDYAQIMGPERAEWMYRGRSLLDHGIRIAGSSDRPVADGAPLRAIQFMLERRSSSGAVIGANEGISVLEALAAYTTDAAYACQLEDQLGSITPGKRADLAVLSADPRKVPAEDIGDIGVLATILDGELVHGAFPSQRRGATTQ